MKRWTRRIALACALAAALPIGAFAQSTINTTKPATQSDLSSLVVRQLAQAAASDINKLFGMSAGVTQPTTTSTGLVWLNTGATPNLVNVWDGAQFVRAASFDRTGHTYTAALGNPLTAWGDLLSSSLGTAGQCLRSNGGSSSPSPQACIDSTSIAKTDPITVSFAGVTATIGLTNDASLAVAAGALGLNLAHSNLFTAAQTINLNSGPLPAALSGAVLNLGGANATVARAQLNAFGSIAAFSGAIYGGTATSPTQVLSGTELASVNSFGYTGSALVGPIASFRSYAAENIGASSWGSKACIATVPVTTTTLADGLCQQNSGGITIGAPTGGDEGSGTLNLAGSLYSNGAAPTGTGGYVRATGPAIANAALSNPTLSGTVAGANTIPLSILAQSAANTILGNATSGTANVTALPIGGCSSAASALQWTSGSGFNCNTAIAAPAGSLTGATLASNVLASSLTSVGTLAGGATGAGFTVALSTSTITGTLPATNLPAFGSGDVSFASGGGAGTIAASAVTPAKMANAAAYSLFGNFTGSSAAPQYSTIGGLTQKASPAGTDLVLIQDQAAAGQPKYALISAVSAAGSVATFNGRNGTVTPEADDYGQYNGLHYTNCGLAASVASNNLTVTLTDAGGNTPSATSPCIITFRNATAATGTIVTRVITSSITMVINSGSTLGTSNGTAFRVYITAFDTGSTAALGLSVHSNATQIFPLNTAATQTSTACSACATATSAGVFYTTATQTSKPINILGEMTWENGLTTAGTWASTPTNIAMWGPNSRLPGAVVQQAVAVATQTDNVSATYVTAVSLAAMTPSSAANLFLLQANGTGEASTGLATGAIAICKGASGCATTNLITALTRYTASSASPGGGISYWDRPNSTSAVTYVVGVAGDGTHNMRWPFGSGSFIGQEIKG